MGQAPPALQDAGPEGLGPEGHFVFIMGDLPARSSVLERSRRWPPFRSPIRTL